MAIRGTMVEMSMRSMTDSQLRKKYMGLWRRESVLMRRIMSPFPERATRNMTMMMEKRRRKMMIVGPVQDASPAVCQCQ